MLSEPAEPSVSDGKAACSPVVGEDKKISSSLTASAHFYRFPSKEMSLEF